MALSWAVRAQEKAATHSSLPKRSRATWFISRPRNPSTPKWPIASPATRPRSEEHTSELQSLMRLSYAVLCLNKKKQPPSNVTYIHLKITYIKHSNQSTNLSIIYITYLSPLELTHYNLIT